MGGIEGAERDQADAERFRDGVEPVVSLVGAFAHEDRVARAVRCIGRLMGEIDEKHGLSRRRVSQGDPVRIAGSRFDDLANDAASPEIVIGKAVEGSEKRRVEAGDAEAHGKCPVRPFA